MKCNDPQFLLFLDVRFFQTKIQKNREKNRQLIIQYRVFNRYNRSRKLVYVGTITFAFFFDHTKHS